MKINRLLFVPVVLAGFVTASAQKMTEVPLPATQNPNNAVLPISGAVWVGNTLYVSGWLDPDMKTHPDTTSQTVGIFKDLEKFLETQKLTLRNVAMVRMFVGGDPAKDGKADIAGMTAGYTQFFGTKDYPNKPARTTLQVVLPAGARGALVEVDLVAVKLK